MTTTTRNTLEIDRVTGKPVAIPAVEQQGKLMDEAAPAPVPWSVLAPSDYAALARWSAFRIPGEEQQAPVTSGSTPRQVVTNTREAQARRELDRMFAVRIRGEEQQAPAMARAVVAESVDDKTDLTRAALLAAVLALVETCVAHLTIEEKHYVFGLFESKSAWVSKGGSQESWPGGSIESSLQGRLGRTPVKVRDLVAKWIGPVQPNPWGAMWNRIVDRLVSQGTVERHKEKRSFLFFNWEKTTHRPARRTKDALADYAMVARRTGVGLPLLGCNLLGLAERNVISGEIDKGFTDRTEPSD